MNRNIEARLQRLESQQDHAETDAVIAFYQDGAFVRAERNGKPYDGPLEGHRIVSHVDFVSPPERSGDDDTSRPRGTSHD